jgi:DNA replication protein DnaC
MSTAAALDILKYQLQELNLGFLLGQIDSFLHREATMERSLVESLSELFDHELTQRKQRAAKTRLKLSRLPCVKTLHDFELEHVEGISNKRIGELSSLAFVSRAENVVFMGPSGLGKSHLMQALVHKACVDGYTSYCLSGQELIEELVKAKHQNRLKRKLASLSKPRLLAIDEIGYQNLNPEESTLFFQLVAQRYEKGSIMVTTNKAFGQWGELLGDTAIATATLDRLLHHAQVIILKGESYRLRKRINLGLVPPGESMPARSSTAKKSGK